MENFRAIELHKVRDFSSKMSATFEFMRQNFLSLGKAFVFIAGPPILVASYFIGDLYGGMASRTGVGSPAPMDWFSSSGFILQMIGIFIFYVLAGVFSVSVVNNYVRLYDEKKTNKIDVSEVWERVRSTFWKYLGTIVLIVLLLIIGYFLAAFMAVMLFQGSIALGIIALIVIMTAFMYLAITLSLILPIRTFEKIGFFEALSRSFYLIYGKWWSTFGIMTIASVIAWIISLLFFIPIIIIQTVTQLHSTDASSFDESPVASMAITIQILYTFYFLFNFVGQALPLLAAMFQYFNLVERKEARGLMSRIETFGEAPEAAAPEHHDEHY
jgi:hypothetical protein